MDNTTFGGNIPLLPQWTGAPHTIIHVQAMLYASLAASVFSAFLAMLGKQWLNRFASTDMRGTAIERSQDRQRKLDGIITWYFDHVMESLPLVLQFALLLLGCALSLYLWEIHVTIACVAIGVTALGVALYAFFVIAGTFSTSCPYQTPGAHILRHIYYRILSPAPGLLHSAFHILVLNSRCLRLFTKYAWGGLRDWKINIVRLIRNILYLPVFFVRDVRKLIFTTVKALIILSRRVSSWIRNARPARVRRLNQRTTVLDSRCVSWILQTSLEKGIRLSTPQISRNNSNTGRLHHGPCFAILRYPHRLRQGQQGESSGCTRDGAAWGGICHVSVPHIFSPLGRGSNVKRP